MEPKTCLEPSLEKQLKGHRNAITALNYSPNEQQIATSSLDNSVLLWDLRGCMRSYRFQGHDEAVMDVTFSPTGKYMASASRDKSVRLWVPTVTGSTGMFRAHSQTVRSVQFSSDSCKILTASDDKIVKLWASENHKFIASFVGHTNWVRCARLSNDGSIIASVSDDKTTRLWNHNDSKIIHVYKDQKGHGLCLAWHPSGCYIAVGTSHGNVKLYDVRTHGLVQYYSIHNEAVSKVAFHPSGSYILTSSKDGKMKILDLLEGHPIFTLSGHNGAVNAVGFSPSGDSFASAGDDKLVFLWKTNFTELQSDIKENMPSNSGSKTSQLSRTTLAKDKNKGTQIWTQCYHTSRYPISTFFHLDKIFESQNCGIRFDERQIGTVNGELEQNKGCNKCQNTSMDFLSTISHNVHGHPNANSTLLNDNKIVSQLITSNGCWQHNANNSHPEQNKTCSRCQKTLNSSFISYHEEPTAKNSMINDETECTGRSCKSNRNNTKVSLTLHNQSTPHSQSKITSCGPTINDNVGVGHLSHIPRIPPAPANVTMPSILTKSKSCTMNDNQAMEGSFFGMIALKENDVCYTSGTIEWVGRKRNYPLNSGFKVIEPNLCGGPNIKKKKSDDTYTIENIEQKLDCECPDVLPTITAIINHLNALHDAVDIVDLRLGNLESTEMGCEK